jgi:hypothetical protein
MYTSFKVSITVLTHRRYNTCRASGLVQIPISLISPRFWGFERYRLWVLKKSFPQDSPKQNRARMTYKRRSRFCWTFSIPRRGQGFQKREFFNSHAWFRQLSMPYSSKAATTK